MIEFLVKRPIAVFMTFLAFVLLGLISLGVMPVSLMPEIDIPHLKIQIDEPNYSAEQLEDLIVSPIRRQLLQVSNLNDIKSKTSNGKAYIDLSFDYGIDVDYAFIEVSDNIDKVMGALPKEVNRPIVVKSNASDIPLLFVNIPYPNDESKINFSSYINNIVKKRLEQNQSISYVDITGTVSPQITISPNLEALERLGVSIKEIENVINENNTPLGSFKIRDGHYVYNILFEPTLSDINNIKNLYINTKEGSYQIKKLADVSLQARDRRGFFYHNDYESLSLAIFNKNNTKIYDTKREVIDYLNLLKKNNPKLNYSISEDQSDFLKLSINNLVFSIVTGTLLAVLIVFLFIKKYKLAFIIGIVIPISLIISFLFLNLLGVTINVISLSGLIVGIGMMIDNSLIVIDNISQYRVQGSSVIEACSKGVYEIIKPLLSSLLTTCAVFVPLVYLSGVPGILFFDQAISIIISLTTSYVTSIILLPTLYAAFNIKISQNSSQVIENKYLTLFDSLFKRKKVVVLSSFLALILGGYVALTLDKQNLPNVRYSDFNLIVNWNEPINAIENSNRLLELSNLFGKSNSKYIGEQNFLLPIKDHLTSKEASIYIKSDSYSENELTKREIVSRLKRDYKNSIVKISKSKNLFEQLFPEDEANLIAKVPLNQGDKIQFLEKKVIEKFPNTTLNFEQDIDNVKLEIDFNKLVIYKIDVEVLLHKLKSILTDNQISILKTTNEYLPIIIKNDKGELSSLIESTFIRNREHVKVPIKTLISINKGKTKENIYADTDKSYIPIIIETDFEEDVIALIKNEISADIEFEGSYLKNNSFIKELLVVLIIVVLLLYFILAAQFESLLQPLIILSEIPLTISLSILIVKLLGVSLNIMSMIGLIITLGIIINDSILKIDAINKSRSLNRMNIIEAIHNAGKKRLNAILMTSLTTVFAMTPIFFTTGIGFDLQKPLAIVVITSMIIGTIVSLYYVPIIYWLFAKKNKNEL